MKSIVNTELQKAINLPPGKMFKVFQKNLKFAKLPKFCKVRLSNLRMGMKNDH